MNYTNLENKILQKEIPIKINIIYNSKEKSFLKNFQKPKSKTNFENCISENSENSKIQINSENLKKNINSDNPKKNINIENLKNSKIKKNSQNNIKNKISKNKNKKEPYLKWSAFCCFGTTVGFFFNFLSFFCLLFIFKNKDKGKFYKGCCIGILIFLCLFYYFVLFWTFFWLNLAKEAIDEANKTYNDSLNM